MSRCSMKILVVDDDPTQLKALSFLLCREGQEVVTASTGNEALALLRARSFDLILLDLKLPDIPGADLVPRIGEISPKAEILIVTGYPSLEGALEAFHPQVVGFLSKPVRADQLDRVIGRLAERRRVAKENTKLHTNVRTAKRQWELTFDAITDPILVADAEGLIVRANQAAHEHFGASSQGVTGASYVEKVHGPGSGAELWPGREALHREAPCVREVQGLVTPGTYSVSSYPVKWENGPAVVHCFRNITERAQAEQRLKALNEIARLVNQSLDLKSVLQSAVSVVSQSIHGERIAVFTVDDKNGSLALAALREEFGDQPSGSQDSLRESFPIRGTRFEKCFTGRHAIYTPDLTSDPFPNQRTLVENGILSDLLVPILSGPELIGALAIGRAIKEAFTEEELRFAEDVSVHLGIAINKARMYGELQAAYDELKNTQRQIIQQERLKAMGAMASGIAHDFNNLLMGILGYAGLLNHGGGLSDRSTGYVRNIEMIAENAAQVVARLREFYRRPADGEDLVLVQMSALVEEALSVTKPRWHDMALKNGTNIEIRKELAEIPTFLGNASELRDVLTNLILNAVDAMPEGGTITIRAGRGPRGAKGGGRTAVTIRPPEKNGRTVLADREEVTLEVIDTGTGMSPEVRGRCLEPFFTTKGKQGTGLGLATLYGTVERHGGSIEIESEVGKGTSFRIRLSVRLGARMQSSAPSLGKVRQLRTLIVDDEPHVREIVSAYLESDGHSVATAEDGLVALERFRKDHFDLVLTDKGMPGLSGDQLAEQIQELAPEVPIIMLTGWAAWLQSHDQLPRGISRVVGKPVTRDKLREAVAEVCQETDDTGTAGSDETPLSAVIG